MKEENKLMFIWFFTLVSICLFVGLFGLHFYFDRVAGTMESEENVLLDYEDEESQTDYKYHGVCMLIGITLLTLGVLIHYVIRTSDSRGNLHCIHIFVQVFGVAAICIGTWLSFMTDKIDPVGMEYPGGKLHTFCGFILVGALLLQMMIGFFDFWSDIEAQCWLDYFPHIHGCTGSWIVINLLVCYFTGLGYRYYLKIGYEDPEYEETLKAMHIVSIVLILSFLPAVILYHYKEQLMSRRVVDIQVSHHARQSVARPSTF